MPTRLPQSKGSAYCPKRRLLARAAIRALQDGAVVDEETAFVRTADAIDTASIRVLALIGERKTDDDWPGDPTKDTITVREIVDRWPGVRPAMAPILASLERAALIIELPTLETHMEIPCAITRYGKEFLDRLRVEGLEDELRRREQDQP